jgi:uncharacterized RDD family membrane protein YckC
MPSATYDAHETTRMHEVHGATLAPFSRRAVAFVIDIGIGAALFVVASFFIVSLSDGRFTFHIAGIRFGPAAVEGVTDIRLTFLENLSGLVWWVLYFGLGTYIGKGRTPGKRIAGIRVVSLVHHRLSLWHSFERALGYGASALEFGFGFMQYFVHPNRRTVHDRIAETIVVDDRRGVADSDI